MARRLRRFDGNKSGAGETVSTYYSEAARSQFSPTRSWKGLDKVGPGLWQSGKDFVGMEDPLLHRRVLPANGAAPGTLETPLLEILADCEGKWSRHAGAGAPPSGHGDLGAAAGLACVRPVSKDYDDLKEDEPAATRA